MIEIENQATGECEELEETAEENEVKPSGGDEVYRCNKCKDKIGYVICPCEVAPKYDPDYEEWKNK